MTEQGGTHLRSIVINREYGSGGREIGRLIAERTGMEFYDTRILAEAAAARGLPSDLLATFDERVVAGQLFDLSIITGADSGTFSLPYRMYGAIAEVITGAAGKAPAVFIGRCADRIVCSSTARTPRARLHAPWMSTASIAATPRATSPRWTRRAPGINNSSPRPRSVIPASTTCA